MSSDAPRNESHEPRPFTRAEVRRALATSMVAWGIFGSAWMAMVSGVVFVTFAREKLHVSIFMYTVLGSLPQACAVAQLLGSHLAEVKRQRRLQCLLATNGNRMVWLLVAALPWVIPAEHQGLRVGVFLGLMLLSSLLGNLSSPAGFSWFADIVPEEIRARYLSRRAALSTFTVIIVSTVVARIIDQHHSFAVFTTIFAIAGVCGLVDINLYCFRVREAPMAPHEGPPWRWWNSVTIPLANRRFRWYALYAFCEAFMNGIVGPFWWLLALEHLKIGASFANLYVMVVPMVFVALALPHWGGICDRFGARPLARLGTLMSLVYPVFWVLATPGHFHFFLAFPAVIGGLFAGALQTADMTMMYALTPRENRSAYMACIMLAASLGYAIAPPLGGALADLLKPVSVHVWGLTLINFHFLMFLSILITLAHATFIIPRLPADSTATAGDVVKHLTRTSLARLSKAVEGEEAEDAPVGEESEGRQGPEGRE